MWQNTLQLLGRLSGGCSPGLQVGGNCTSLCYGVSDMGTLALRNGVIWSQSVIHRSARVFYSFWFKYTAWRVGCFFPSKIQVIIFSHHQQTTTHILKIRLQVSQITIKQAYKWNDCISSLLIRKISLKTVVLSPVVGYEKHHKFWFFCVDHPQHQKIPGVKKLVMGK